MINVDLTINTDVAHQILTGFIHSEVTRVGYMPRRDRISRAVLIQPFPLSWRSKRWGGKMSWPCACLTRLRRPIRWSMRSMLIDAMWDAPSETVDITDMVEPLFTPDPEMSKQRKGNIMARQRMIVLYDRSETFKGLVIGTSNKTEILLGYSTLWGDMASALNPIGDLYKTQVRQLSRALGVPSEIIDKAAFRRPVDGSNR